MNALPTEHDLGFLVGSTLFQVCIGENEVILRLSAEISITIESSFLIRDSSGLESEFNDSRSSAGSLVKLLSNTVTKVRCQRDGTLSLWFSSGDILEAYDSSEGYESYQIQHGKDIYVV